MITAVDTSVLIDVFRNDPRFGARSADGLRRCIKEGQVVVCDIVWAELAAVFPTPKAFDEAMRPFRLNSRPRVATRPSWQGRCGACTDAEVECDRV